MVEQPDLTLVRVFDADRYVLQRADGQELAVLSHGVPGDASVRGQAVRLTVARRNRRVAIVASDKHAELGSIQFSWVPGRYRTRLGHSNFRVARHWLRGGWNVSRQRDRLATLELNRWFSSSLNLVGASQRDAGHVVLSGHLQDADIAMALVLLLEMIRFDIPVPAVSGG